MRWIIKFRFVEPRLKKTDMTSQVQRKVHLRSRLQLTLKRDRERSWMDRSELMKIADLTQLTDLD